MALVKPIAQQKNAFDANNDEVFYFITSGGDQVVKNKLTIRRQNDNVVVYENTQETYQFNQTLPNGTLTNGEYYNYYFTTYDINDNESPQSNSVAFYCYTTPTIQFTNISSGDIVENASYTFEFNYNQEENELFDFVILDIYDASNKIIKTSGQLYYSGSNELSYEINGLEEGVDYKLEVNGVTINGTVFSSEKIIFDVKYTNPIFYSKLDLVNKCKDGYIQIRSNLIVVDGISQPSPPVYIEGDTKISMLNYSDFVKWLEGYEIQDNFIIEIWGSPSRIEEFFRIWDENNNNIKLSFVREIPYGESDVKDYFTISGIVDSEEELFTYSNFVPIMNNTTNYVVWVKKNGNNYEAILDILSQEDNVFEWDNQDYNNVVYDKITDISWDNESYKQGEQLIQKFENIDKMFPLHNTMIRSGEYNHLNITSDVTKQYSTEIPEWDYYTSLDCDFNGNIKGGNVNIIMSMLSGIRVKRRDKGSFEWITIKENKVETIEDINFSLEDFNVPSNKKQEYALVPIMTNGEIEGDYIISEIEPYFDGVFISNKDKIFKLYNGVAYGDFSNNKQIGTLQPIGSKYPYIVQNSITQYESGSITGSLYGYEFEENRIINKHSIMNQAQDLIDILNSGMPMCIKDWNGNIWICAVSENESIQRNLANGHITISFNFIEQGKYNNQEDLYDNGLL